MKVKIENSLDRPICYQVVYDHRVLIGKSVDRKIIRTQFTGRVIFRSFKFFGPFDRQELERVHGAVVY